jgi:tRNA (cmo5U34)-methyltransferase
MEPAQLEATFDKQSVNYDQQWAKLAAVREGIHLLLGSLFARLPQRARMLCVGAGTGAEIDALASHFPATRATWRPCRTRIRSTAQARFWCRSSY